MSFRRAESAGYLVNHAARLFAKALQEEIGRHGVWPGYFPVLLVLWENDGRTQAEIARLVDVQQPTLANTLRRMRRDGLIRRVPDPTDRRAERIHMTPRARGLEEPLTRSARRVNEQALRGLGRVGRSALLGYLRHTIVNLRGASATRPS